MIVCHCARVSDREIKACMETGASTVAEVGRACGAGGGCGGCRPEIAAILSDGRECTLKPRGLPVLKAG